MSWLQVIDDTFTRANAAVPGNNWTDLHGGVFSISSDVLIGSVDGSGGFAGARDICYRQAAEECRDQRIVLKFIVPTIDSSNSVNACLRYQAGPIFYFVNLAFNSNAAGFFAYNGGLAGIGASQSCAFTAGHEIQADFSVTGVGPTTLAVTITDLTSSTVLVNNYSTTDNIAALQNSSGVPAISINGNGGDTFHFVEAITYTTSLIQLTAPVAYQTVQRNGSDQATVAISGTNGDTGTHDIEASFNGGSYTTIASAVAGGGTFSGSLTGQAGGQGSLVVRFKDTPAQSVNVAIVGIGDIFIIGGQSNASGRGANNQVPYNANIVATMFGNNYSWQQLADPVDAISGQVDTVSQDDSGHNGNAAPGGTIWPLIATQYMAAIKRPIAFVPCCLGGSAIYSGAQSINWYPFPPTNHQDRTTLYGSLVHRAIVTGAKCILWWQGESDAINTVSQANYLYALQALGDAFYADLGIPLMPCKLQNMSGAGIDNTNVNAAIGQAWGTHHIIQGPDLSDIVADNGAHITDNAHVSTVAARWWQAIYAAFYAPATSTTVVARHSPRRGRS